MSEHDFDVGVLVAWLIVGTLYLVVAAWVDRRGRRRRERENRVVDAIIRLDFDHRCKAGCQESKNSSNSARFPPALPNDTTSRPKA